MSAPHTFHLSNSEGRSIEYMLTPHDPLNGGIDLMLNLLALAMKPLGRLLDSNVAFIAKSVTSKGIEGFLSQDLGALAEVELGAASFGDDFAAFLARVSGPKLIQEVLKETYRDGKHLADPAVFNAAYTRNYGEMIGAFKEVVKYNGFLDTLLTFAEGLQKKGTQELANTSKTP